MAEQIEKLEKRIDSLRAEIRRAVSAGDRARAAALRAELHAAEGEWEQRLATIAQERGEAIPESGSLLPLREQVHQGLTLLGAPGAARLVITVHAAFFSSDISNARLTSLRRDEERSFNLAPFARPYYLCSALTSDLLAPARGLLAISSWPLEQRIMGPLSARVDFLRSAINLSEAVARLSSPSPQVRRLLWRFASSIPGAADGIGSTRPDRVAEAAKVELAVHEEADASHRAAAARRARAQLDEAGQLFGSKLRAAGAGT